MRTVLLPLTIALLIACTSDKKNLTNASGPVGDVYVVMDSAQRKGQIGIILDSILGADMPGLPRKESIFKIHWVDARRLNYLLKERRNMVYVLTLDQRSQGSAIIRGLFTPESIEKIKSDYRKIVSFYDKDRVIYDDIQVTVDFMRGIKL